MNKKLIFASLLFIILLTLVKEVQAIDISTCSVLDTAGGYYTLTADIINSSASTCMDIQADNIVLDCQGHLIDGVDGSNTYGIKVPVITNITIKNCVLTDWAFGFYGNSNINTLSNITANSNGYGIVLSSSDSNTLSNITADSNSQMGIQLYYSDYTVIKDSIFINNANWDVRYVTNRTTNDCHSDFINVIGTDNKPIVFFNSSVTIKNWDNNASEIILCGADNSVIDNVTMSHTNVGNNGLLLVATNLTNISNSIFNNSKYGIYLAFSSSNTLSNITANSNYYGIYLSFSDSNTIKNSIIQNNSQYGIYLYSAGSTPNLIYNNLFNNTNNFYFTGTIYANNWNTTRQEGTRIYSFGNEIGGNYWTNPDGTGYSDTCADADKDGFCDDPYVLNANNTDYLALSDEYPPPTTTTLPPVHGVPLLSRTLVGIAIGFGVLAFMLKTLFDIREPKKVIEYFIALAVIVLTVIALIVLFA